MSVLIYNRKVMGAKFYSYKEWLHDLEDRIVLFTQVERPDLASYDHVEVIESFDRYGLTEVRAVELDRYFAFKRIVPHSEYDLIRAARLREYFGLPGQNVKSAVAYRDKVHMKELLRKAGISVADFRRLESPLDLYLFALDKGFPVIVKPVDAGGARRIQVLHDMDELKTFLAQGLPQDSMVEKFVEGDMYHADGVVQNGRLLFSCVSRYVNGCLAFQRLQSVGSFTLNPHHHLTRRINALIPEIVDALPYLPEMAFHAEFFYTKDDEIIVCEIASRTAGGRIMETVEASYGVDIIKTWVRMQCGLPVDVEPRFRSSVGYLVIPPRAGKLASIPERTPFPWVIDYKPTVEAGCLLNNPTTNGDNIAIALVEADEEVIESRLCEFDEWFNASVRWDAA